MHALNRLSQWRIAVTVSKWSIRADPPLYILRTDVITTSSQGDVIKVQWLRYIFSKYDKLIHVPKMVNIVIFV